MICEGYTYIADIREYPPPPGMLVVKIEGIERLKKLLVCLSVCLIFHNL